MADSSSATASPTSLVLADPPMSPVLVPLSIVLRTASSTAFDSSGRFKECFRSIAMESIAATGLTMPLPEMSGAEPLEHQPLNGGLWGEQTYRGLARISH